MSSLDHSTTSSPDAGNAPAAPSRVLPTAADPATLARAARHDLVDGLLMWELWGRLSWNEVRRRYRRTMLGPLWVTVSLAIFALALSVVWASLWKQNVPEYLPFLLSGLIPWMLLSSALGEACGVFITGEAIMKSRQFPYTVLVHQAIARNTIVFAHNLLAYAVAAVLCGVPFNANTLLAVPGLVLLLFNLEWMSIMVGILCLRFRDFQPLVATILQISMFITPVFWPAAQLQGRVMVIVDANLLYHMIDVVRSPLLGKAPALYSYVVCVGFGIAGWCAAYWLLMKKRHRMVYWY